MKKAIVSGLLLSILIIAASSSVWAQSCCKKAADCCKGITQCCPRGSK